MSTPEAMHPAHADQVALGEPAVALDVVLRAVFHTLLLLAVYFLLDGHNAPGGGFIGGLVAGGALVLRFITGRPQFRARVHLPPSVLLGVGIVLVTATALTSLALGNTLLEHHTVEVALPVFGDVKATSALVFDTGIFLIVVGVVATLLDVLGPTQGRVPDAMAPGPPRRGRAATSAREAGTP